MPRTSLPPQEEVSLKPPSRKHERPAAEIFRIALSGRNFVTLHSGPFTPQADTESLAAKHFPLPPKLIREWLTERRREGHFAHACTTLAITNANLFSNVPLPLPYVQDGMITYTFADSRIATWFKLSFA